MNNVYKYKAEQDEIAVKLGYVDAVDAMGKLYKNGQSYREIGLMFGVSRQTIYIRLRKLGVVSRPRGGANMHRVVITKDIHKDIMTSGDSNKALAQRCGISAPTVAKIKRGYVPDIRG